MEASEFFLKLLLIFVSAKVFAEVAKRGGIFDDATYAVVVFVVALTTLLAPVALRYIMKDDSEA